VSNIEILELKKRTLTKNIDVPIVEDIQEEEELVKLDALGRAYATGRRKQSSAGVWLSIGDSFKIGKMELKEYFPQEFLCNYLLDPMKIAGMSKAKIYAKVSGGGKVAQAQALRLAIAKALVIFDPNLKTIFKAYGFLTTDARRKEREHCGFRTSRKPQQYRRR